MTELQAISIAERFGYTARQVPLGFFLAPVHRDRFGLKSIGSDEMLVKHGGEIVPYEHNAQAFLVAKAVAAGMLS